MPRGFRSYDRHTLTKKLLVVRLLFNSIILKMRVDHLDALFPANSFEIMLPCPSQNERIKLLEIIGCFNCEQLQFPNNN